MRHAQSSRLRRVSVVGLVALVGAVLVPGNSLFAGDRKFVEDSDGGLWCAGSSCDPEKEECCGSRAEII